MRQQHPGSDASAPTDSALALMARQGDDAAFTALISRYVPLVKSRAFGYRDAGIEPEDLAQEGMIGLTMAVRTFRPEMGTSFGTYARLCVDRAIITAVRATLRAKAIPPAALVPIQQLEQEGYAVPAGGDPESALLQAEDTAALMAQLTRRLSATERQVLLLYVGGCRYDEIARRLGLSPKGVDNALQRARRKLRQT